MFTEWKRPLSAWLEPLTEWRNPMKDWETPLRMWEGAGTEKQYRKDCRRLVDTIMFWSSGLHVPADLTKWPLLMSLFSLISLA